MPELPEVETVRRGLSEEILGERLRLVTLYRPDLRYPFEPDFARQNQGRELRAITRRAKFLIFDFGGQGFLGHLGMTGSYRTAPMDEERRKHDHFTMIFSDRQTIYHDPRRFGAVSLFAGDPMQHRWLQKLGPEPLGNHFDGPSFYRALKPRKITLKQALLNQEIIAGVGNIYACEALWQARLSPKKSAAAITQVEAERLAFEIRDVLTRAIEAGGSTLRDFRNASGGTGYFQHDFYVYDREGQACRRDCGAKIKRIVQSGRSTFYCPKCQSLRKNAKKTSLSQDKSVDSQ